MYPYANAVLKREVFERVRRVVLSGIGYRSVSEFVTEAVLKRLEEVEPLVEKLERGEQIVFERLPVQPAARTKGTKALAYRLPARANAEAREAERGDEPRSSFEKEKKEVVSGG